MKTVITHKIENKNIRLKKNEKLTYVAILKDGWKKPKRLNFLLEGKNSSITFLGFIIGKNTEDFPFETYSNHEAQNTSGYFSTISILFDKSSVEYSGTIKAERNANKTESYLNHHTLMFSDNTKTSTTPSLKIKNDDVVTGHSASIGNVDEDIVFYLQTRGINRELCEKLMVKKFIESGIQKIRDKKTRRNVIKEIDKLLTNQ
ncbi:hypothetical protein GF366_02745 [Candidatus Peregrinibacteria bacterium]|nr:hypothetical protein [Candidatus Peregrinibacteria bacterium]